jgi:hypothetical protein
MSLRTCWWQSAYAHRLPGSMCRRAHRTSSVSGTQPLKYEHLYRATIGDGNALAAEASLFRHTCNTLQPHQAPANAHHARLTSPPDTAISVGPLADPLLDWEVLT